MKANKFLMILLIIAVLLSVMAAVKRSPTAPTYYPYLSCDSLLILSKVKGTITFSATTTGYVEADSTDITKATITTASVTTLSVSTWVSGIDTFGSGVTADTVVDTLIEADHNAFITLITATDSNCPIVATVLEDTLIVSTAKSETGAIYNYLLMK